MKPATCEEIEKDKLFEQFKSEAKTALESCGKYQWKYEAPNAWNEKVEIDNAINFVMDYEINGLTIDDLLKEIFKQCDGKNNGNAKLITIGHMSKIIAHWEVEALLNE